MNSNLVKPKRPFMNLICVITVWSFLFNAVGAGILIEDAMAVSPALPVPVFNGADMQIPLSFGEIKDTIQGTNDSTVIHIQDAHCNYSAQHSISNIISYLSDNYDVNLVMLEGGKGNYDLSVFTKIENPETRNKVSDYFVKQGRVSGAEYFAINNPNKVTLFGIEDENLYMANLNAYKKSLSFKKEADGYLEALTRIVDNLKREIYSSELIELDEIIKAYREKDTDFKKYVTALSDKTQSSQIELSSFKNITLLIEILIKEGGINFEEANKERAALVGKLEAKLSKFELERLVKMTVDFKKQDITNEDFYAYLFKKARFANVDFTSLPNLVEYSKYVKEYEAIDKGTLFREIKTLESALMEKMLNTDDEKTLYALDKNLQIMKNMFNVSLIKEDYDYYLANKSDFNTQNFLNFFRCNPERGQKGRVEGSYPTNNLINLDSFRKTMENFYAYSLKRDNAFIENMESKLKRENKKVTILVTGGFHTGNLKDIFKTKGYSYVEVMPKMDTQDVENPYFRLLSGGKSQVETLVDTTIQNSNIPPLHLLSERGITGTSDKNLLELSVDVSAALETDPEKGIVLMVTGGYLRLTHEKSKAEFFEEVGKIDNKPVYAAREEKETYDPKYEKVVIVKFDRESLTYGGHQDEAIVSLPKEGLEPFEKFWHYLMLPEEGVTVGLYVKFRIDELAKILKLQKTDIEPFSAWLKLFEERTMKTALLHPFGKLNRVSGRQPARDMITEYEKFSRGDFNAARMPDEIELSNAISDDAALAVAYSALLEGRGSEFSPDKDSGVLNGLESIIKNSDDEVAKAIAYSALVSSVSSEFNPYGGIKAVDALEMIIKNSSNDTANAIAYKRLAKYYSIGKNVVGYLNVINGLESIVMDSKDKIARAMACCTLSEYCANSKNPATLRALRYSKVVMFRDINNDVVRAVIAGAEDSQKVLTSIIKSDTASFFAKAISAAYLSKNGWFGIGAYSKSSGWACLKKIIEDVKAKQAGTCDNSATAKIPEVSVITEDINSGIQIDRKLWPLSLETDLEKNQMKKTLFSVLNEAFKASAQNLFEGEPLMVSLPINSEKSGVTLEEFAKYMGAVQGVRVNADKKSLEFNVGNITYYLFEDDSEGHAKLLDRLEVKQTERNLTNEEMARRNIVYSFAEGGGISDITKKAFTVYLEGEIDRGEYRTPTPIGRCIAASIKLFNLFDLTRPNRNGITDDVIKTAEEDAIRGIVAISGLSSSEMRDMAEGLISRAALSGLFALSGQLFIKIRPVNWKGLIEFHKIEAEVLRAV
ncbi:MAG: hypothetical protein ABH844_06270 [Candidatus Omnitrophota bacterium]